MRVGVHGRNATNYEEADFELIERAKIDQMVVMSFTEPANLQRIRTIRPDLEFLIRLYTGGFGPGHHPGAMRFCSEVIPQVARLQPFAKRFQIHNEPNHAHGTEGWDASNASAKDFAAWYDTAFTILKSEFPHLQFGFPGLAVPGFVHRDYQWLDICARQIQMSDFLGAHAYWQGVDQENMWSDQWGLRFKNYHKRFPNKRIELTEVGNSTEGIDPEVVAYEYPNYYSALMHYPYLGGVSPFIASSPDPQWGDFTWRYENGNMKPVVEAVGWLPRIFPPTIPEIINVRNQLPVNRKAKPYGRRSLNQLRWIVFHHSDAPPSHPVERVAWYHTRVRKYRRIAYHFYVGLDYVDGVPVVTIYQTNRVRTRSWHTGGDANTFGIGVCIAGSFMNGRIPHELQIQMAEALCDYLYYKFPSLTIDCVKRHKDFRQTACPGKTSDPPDSWYFQMVDRLKLKWSRHPNG